MFNNLLSEIVLFMRYDEKYGGDREATNDVTMWRIGVATCTQAHAHAHVTGHTYARTRVHARTHARTHSNIQYVLLFHGNNDSRTRLNITLFVHCLSCLFWGTNETHV